MQINNKDGKIMLFFLVIMALIIGFGWYQYKNNPKVTQKIDNYINSQDDSSMVGKLKIIKNAEDTVKKYNEAGQKSADYINSIAAKHGLGEE